MRICADIKRKKLRETRHDHDLSRSQYIVLDVIENEACRDDGRHEGGTAKPSICIDQ